jgi:hypothetical protein
VEEESTQLASRCRVALSPECQIGYMDHTGGYMDHTACNQLVFFYCKGCPPLLGGRLVLRGPY